MSNGEQLPHLVIAGRTTSEPYRYAGAIPRGEIRLPPRERASHGTSLLEQLDQASPPGRRGRGESAPVVISGA
jgi:hypothetical protein